MSPMSISLDNSKSLSIGLFLLDLFSLGYQVYVWFPLDYYSLAACLNLEKSTSSSCRGLRIWRMWYHIAPSRFVRITPANAVDNALRLCSTQAYKIDTTCMTEFIFPSKICFQVKLLFFQASPSWPFWIFYFLMLIFAPQYKSPNWRFTEIKSHGASNDPAWKPKTLLLDQFWS